MPGYAEDLYRAIFAIQSLPRHWKDLTRVCLGQVTVNGFRFLSKCPQVRILELDTDKYREEYLAEYGDPVALMGSWPVQAQPLNITKLYLTLGDVKDLVLVKLLPNLRTLLLEPPVTGCKSPFGGDVWVRCRFTLGLDEFRYSIRLSFFHDSRKQSPRSVTLP
jgi:hypothetical protein